MGAITVFYNAIDGALARRKFKTLAGARGYAVKMVGATPEFGSYYAVSGDGIGKITVEGCTLRELFAGAVEAPKPFEVWAVAINEDQGTSSPYKAGAFATLAEASAFIEREGDGMDGVRVVPIGEVAGAEYDAALIAAIAEQERAEREFEARAWAEFYGNGGF